MVYPALDHPAFATQLVSSSNYQTLKLPEVKPVLSEAQFEKRAAAFCEGYEKTLYQYIAQQHISPTSPYRGILLYHGLGFGKTCSAITFAEAWLDRRVGTDFNYEVWVIASNALTDNFKNQLYRRDAGTRQCMGEAYRYLTPNAIPSRYKFYTYDKFGSLVKDKEQEGIQKLKAWARNRILIIDEAHNLRNPTIRGAIGLERFLTVGTNNRLVLLSATPMFDQPDELTQLLYYLVLNDHRTDLPMSPTEIKEASFYTTVNGMEQLNDPWIRTFQQLCANYVSYVKGRNPFTLATRLAPAHSGLPQLTPTNVPKQPYFNTPSTDSGQWLSIIEDGLYPTELSELHSDVLLHTRFIKETVKTKMAAASTSAPIQTNILEGTNVLYPGSKGKRTKPTYYIGSDGFQAILQSHTIPNTNKSYYDYYTLPYLYPSNSYLKTYAGKLYAAAKHLQASKGIVLIYSHFIWSGVMPMAVVLEHLGYQRYQESNLLKPNAVDAGASDPKGGLLPKTPGRHYTILCSDPTISGVEQFQGLLDIINGDANRDGEQIKVVLMSPVASEGISFQNVREVHILDPWYHLNRLEQVIGRSIRTCSHVSLPLSERNVTVFLHVTQYAPKVAKDRETYDLYTYRMASEKKQRTTEIETILRDNAMDCLLQEAVNYYPKRLFPFELKQRTSQGVETFVQLGDPESQMPRCRSSVSKRIARRGWRPEMYAPLKNIAKERLRKQLTQGTGAVTRQSWDIERLFDHLKLPPELGWLAVGDLKNEPFSLSDGTTVVVAYHRQKLWLKPVETQRIPQRIHIRTLTTRASPIPDATDATDCEALVENLLRYDFTTTADNASVIMVTFLTLLNVDCWEPMAKRIVVENIQTPLTETLWKEGWLVASKELQVGAPASAPAWIGYALMDLWKKDTDMFVRIHEANTGVWRDATAEETRRLKNARTLVPEMEPLYGFFSKFQKANQPATFKFKLRMDTAAKREKTGIVGTSLASDVLRDLIARLQGMLPRPLTLVPNFTVKENQTNRTYLTSWIAYYLGMLGRLRIPPYYKP